MTGQPRSSQGRKPRVMLVALGTLLVGYALSDHPFYGGERGFGHLQALIMAAGAGIALCSALPIRLGERVLLVAVSSLFMLAFAEVASEPILAPQHRPIFQSDDKLIFKLIPNRRSTMTRSSLNGGETVTHRINSDGFRGEELKSARNIPRVVVYGDSFIHAPYAADKETFTSVLGASLSARVGGEVEVINAGVSSYGPDQVSAKMEKELPELRPDLAIVAIFAGNDYGDLMRNKMFRVDSEGSLLSNSWRLDPNVRSRFELSQRESILIRALRTAMKSLRSSTNSTNIVFSVERVSKMSNWSFLLRQAENEYSDFVVERNDVVSNTHVDYYSADSSLTPRSESARYKNILMQAILRRIRDIASTNDVPLVFVFIPHPVDVATRYDRWEAVDLDHFPQYRGRNQTIPLEESAKSAGVPFVSLYDAFSAVDANTLYFHDDDDHWNAAGQRMAAELTSGLVAHELLRRRGLVGKPTR